jgi:hypothetical protein
MSRLIQYLLAFTFTLIGFNTYAQEKEDTTTFATEVLLTGKPYHAKVRLINGQKLKGILKSIGAYSIQMDDIVYKRSHGNYPTDSSTVSGSGQEIQYGEIMDIKIRGSAGEVMGGFLVGALVGTLVGGVAGLALPCEDCNADEKVGAILFLGALGGVALAPVGAMNGPFIVHVTVDGEYSNYEKFKKEMEAKRIKRIRKQKK